MTNVLVVDDEPTICSMLRMILEGAEYAVETAPNGREALNRAAHAQPDVVVSDILMPVLDGHQLYAAMNADPRYREIPVIFMSTDRPIALRDGEHPAAIIPKPFDIDAFVATVERVAAK
jgi:CheY-like chemotaxis protein